MATNDADLDLIIVFKSGATERLSLGNHKEAIDRIRVAVNSGYAWFMAEDLILNLSELAMVALAPPNERDSKNISSGASERKGDDASRAMSITQFLHQQNISRSHLYKLIKDGKGPRLFKLGKRVLISQEAAAEWRANVEAAQESVSGVRKTEQSSGIECATNVDSSANVYIKDLGFPRRTAHWLMAAGIITVDDLLARNCLELLRLPNIGRKTIKEIRDVLKARGLRLEGDV